MIQTLGHVSDIFQILGHALMVGENSPAATNGRFRMEDGIHLYKLYLYSTARTNQSQSVFLDISWFVLLQNPSDFPTEMNKIIPGILAMS